VESTSPRHFDIAQEIVGRCLPLGGKSVRIGITGIPGVGKSTFIETFGLYAADRGKKLAVLTIDPSSEKTKGSILGDKTRMERLSVHPSAFIRPSPSAGTLGGVARKTRETIILCEAAGFNTILVETVGVGQSETAARTMVDFFLLLMVSGAGDELQGIKRGIMEMADAIAVTKADGDNIIRAENTRNSFQNAINLFPLPPSKWKPLVVTCSAHHDEGIRELWDIIGSYVEFTGKTGYFDELRKQQAIIRMNNSISESLYNSFYNMKEIIRMMPEIEKQLYDGTITSYRAAMILLDKYFEKQRE
jgi:LAO/AO transport system kinase